MTELGALKNRDVLLTLAIGAAPAAIGDGRKAGGRLVLGGALVMLVALYAGGLWRLSQTSLPDTALVVRVVQPNIPQTAKWSPEAFAAIVGNYADLTATPARRTPWRCGARC